jgi:hypothetical protein
MKETRVVDSLPFVKDEHIEILSGNEKYGGTVTRITPQFTYLASDSEEKEIVLPNASILSGKYVITKDKNSDSSRNGNRRSG